MGKADEDGDWERIDVDDKVIRCLQGNSGEQDLNKILANFGVTIMKNGFKELVTNLLTYLTDSRCIMVPIWYNCTILCDLLFLRLFKRFFKLG